MVAPLPRWSSFSKNWVLNTDIVSRKLHDGSPLTYRDIDEKLMRENCIIINTTPLGMYPKTDECPDIPYSFITDRHLLFDLVYNPAETLFLKKGKERGAIVKNGEEMLVLQAEESWRIWNEWRLKVGIQLVRG